MEPRAGSSDAEPIVVEDAELELIDRGLDAAARGELVDARAFLEQLRRTGSSGEAAR